jgi:hypothetical protein
MLHPDMWVSNVKASKCLQGPRIAYLDREIELRAKNWDKYELPVTCPSHKYSEVW